MVFSSQKLLSATAGTVAPCSLARASIFCNHSFGIVTAALLIVSTRCAAATRPSSLSYVLVVITLISIVPMPVLTVLSAPPWVFIGAMSCSFPNIIHMRGAAPSALLAAIDVGSPYACRTSREASANGALTLITLKGLPVCLSMIAVPSRSM